MPIDSPRPISTSCNDVNGAAGRCSGVQARAERALNAGRQCRVSPRLYRRTGARSAAARLRPLRPRAFATARELANRTCAKRRPISRSARRSAASCSAMAARIACSFWSARRGQDTQNGRDDPLSAIRPTNCARTMEARGRSRPAFVSIRTILRRHARTCFPACGPTMSTPCVPL